MSAGRSGLGVLRDLAYDTALVLYLLSVLAWLVVLFRRRRSAPALRRLGVFVLLPVVVLMFLGGTVLYAEAAPLVPALNSYWIATHISAAASATGILVVRGGQRALPDPAAAANGRAVRGTAAQQ
ncbi:MAG: hypothetical protein ACRDT0_10680 [Pseudonocardiaceae bacterium]